MADRLFSAEVLDVVEHEDGSATYFFDIDNEGIKRLAKTGLQFSLYCAAYDLDLSYVLDNLQRLKDE